LDGGELVSRQFKYPVRVKERDTTSREELESYSKTSGMPLNPSYIDFISEIGAGHFWDYGPDIFSFTLAVNNQESFAPVFVEWISNFFEGDVQRKFDTDNFIDNSTTSLLLSATGKDIFVYNHDANDNFFSIRSNPELLFCHSREGEIHLYPEGFYNLFLSVDANNEPFDYSLLRDFPPNFTGFDQKEFFDFEIKSRIQLDEITRNLTSRVSEASNFILRANDNLVEILDLEHLYRMSIYQNRGVVGVSGCHDFDSFKPDIATYFRHHFITLE
jgi:hypothetical protein